MRKLIFFLAFALIGCVQTKSSYQAYEGRADLVIEGEGGTKKIVKGYEIWDNGTPPRRFKVLGVAAFNDLDNYIGRSRLESAMSKAIAQAGGDAAVILSATSQGRSVGQAYGYNNGQPMSATVVTVGRQYVRIQIIKYMDAKQ